MDLKKAKRREYDKQNYLKNKEKHNKNNKEYYLNNRERILNQQKEHRLDKKEYDKEYRLNNRGKILEKKKEYYLKNKEKMLESSKEYHLNNRGKISKQKKDYQLNNRPKINAYLSNKRKTDLVFGLTEKLRTRLKQALNGKSKSKRTLELLGCTVKYLIEHLEKQFQPGMNWQERHLFHIDHIRPCASFDLNIPEEQEKCFHYTNLQPLWAQDNLSKGAKYES